MKSITADVQDAAVYSVSWLGPQDVPNLLQVLLGIVETYIWAMNDPSEIKSLNIPHHY